MSGFRFTSFLLFIIALFFAAAPGAGCANPIAPTGGPKDTLPPALVEVVPKDSMLQFAEKKITFSFDEFVQLDNWRDQVIISPLYKHDPEISSKLRTVTIKIKDTLEENTTYTYNFGNAIKDINEGNIAKNFTYVFSTGKYIDSLELSGTVIIAQTGKADSTLIVMLHRNGADSALKKEKPRYFTRLDSKGHFIFRHLPPGVFYLYALTDAGGQKIYTSPSQYLAFENKPVTIGKNNPPDTLYDYLEKDTATVKAPAQKPVAKTDKEKAKEKEKDKRLKFSMNLENNQQDLLSDLVFIFTDPLKNFDSSKARLTDENFKTVANYSFTKDTSNKKLTISYKWPENTVYNLIVDKEFAEDSAGRKIPRTDTLKFSTKKESDYGNLNIQLVHLDLSKKPVLQLMQGEEVKFHLKLTSNKFHDARFPPGDYEIRILFDDNDNGIWDTGDFFGKHRQPEKVIAVPKKLSVKANWDNDNTIEL
jgi:hypothetical protein